ncbi:uncharacterized protein LOC130054978 [Ostrea edulis]|uniref:uncharacterized protein LOC130054978 n=1 Tax=Ostrea edulis TaxID=37623 RepID=UPI0024AFF40F|nr:uncharacterized protein LOC130054978 [Ostrea edulis]
MLKAILLNEGGQKLSLGQQFEDNTSELESLRKENFCLRRELQVLKSVVINLDRRLTQQENEVVDLRGRSMRDNILIHNLPEEEDEDLSHKVRGLIKEHLQIDVNFVRIHRNGQKNSGSTRPRTITGKLQNSSNKDRILSAIRQKRETSGLSDMLFYITPQTPLQMNENKKKLQEMNNKYREENVKTKIVGNKLVFPNGNIYRDRVLPPRAEDILMMDDQEVDKLSMATSFLKKETFSRPYPLRQIHTHRYEICIKKYFETQISPVQITTYWRTDSKMQRVKFTMVIVTMVNTGPVDAC